MKDPIAAFHRLEDLVTRRSASDDIEQTVRDLRARLGQMRTASASEWAEFYTEALQAARALARPAAAALSVAERRYLDALFADIREAPTSVAELWSRRLQDQRDELVGKAREEVARLALTTELQGGRVHVRVAPIEGQQWVDWLEHYLGLWTKRVITEVPTAIRTAQKDALTHVPDSIAPHAPQPPQVPEEPFSASIDADWTGLAADGTVASAWSLFGRSARGGLFAVMTIATLGGSAAAALGTGTSSSLSLSRGLIVLMLLVPVLIWAHLSSRAQRQSAIDDLTKKLDADVRQRVLQATQFRIDARFRSLRGWLQRQIRTVRTHGQAWLRSCQLQLADTGASRQEARVQSAISDVIVDLEARSRALATAEESTSTPT